MQASFSSEFSLHHDHEPIVALASSRGMGPIAVVRVSGPQCHGLLLPCLQRKGQVNEEKWPDRYLHYCHFIDPRSGEILDDPLVCFFSGPHSYTGQDSAEIYLHGSPYIIETLIGILLRQGFRPAEAGEFTRRAFLQGKMDLSAAEGVRELLAASSHQQWLAARQLTSGKLHQAIDVLREAMVDAQAWLAARIDFPDEKETSAVELHEVTSRVTRVSTAIDQLLATYNSGQVAQGGLKVALVGEPNAGKSTLLNTLLSKNRAIVSAQPGTTRDYLEESCLLEGRLLRLLDTAGLRETSCEIEQEGIKRSLELARTAELVLLLIPRDSRAEVLREQIERLEHAGIAFQLVLTKGDLPLEPSLEQSLQQLASYEAIEISCQGEQGIGALKAFMIAHVDGYVQTVEGGVCISSVRHKVALEQAQAALQRFFAAHAVGAYDELLAFELLEASEALDSIVGKIAADDILGAVFSTFCVGK